MRLIHSPAAVAAVLLAIPSVGLAQAAQAPPAASANAAPAAATSPAAVTAGLPVVDKDGKAIGKVTKVQTDDSGKTVATIRMGADSFGVNASALAVDHGAAKLNFTKSQLSEHLKGR